MTAPTPGHSLAEMISQAVSLESQIVVAAEQNAGEIDAVLDGLLAELTTAIETKVDRYKFVMERLEIGAETMANEADKFYAASAALQNAAKRLKERLKETMVVTGQKELLGQLWKFTLSQNPDRLEVNMKDFLSWPSAREYSTPVEMLQPNKDMIRDALQAGAEIPGCRLVPSTTLRQLINKVRS